VSPHLIAGAVIVAVAFFSGWKVNGWRITSAQKKADEVELRATKAATDAAVDAINGLGKIYVPIKGKAEVITHEVPVYRDCVHDPRGLHVVNQALAGGIAPPDSGDSVPGTKPAE
jgi:hypothetical protein